MPQYLSKLKVILIKVMIFFYGAQILNLLLLKNYLNLFKSKLKTIAKGIRLVDFFGVNPRWYVRGNPRSSSSLGIFFTLLMMGFILWAIIDFSSDFVNRRNPKVAFSNLAGVALLNNFELNPDSFSYVFGIQNGETAEFYIDSTIFTLSGELVYQNQTRKNFTLVKCNPSDINVSIGYSGDLLCFDKNRNDIYLSGINSIATLTFSMCKNSSANNFGCKSQADLDLVFSRKDQLFLFFPVSSAQLNNYTVPIIMNWNYQNFYLDSTLTKRLSLMPKKLQIVTDDGWVSSSLATISKTVHETFFCDIAHYVTGNFFSVEIFTNGNVEYISRTYQKIQDVLAQIMGITQTLLIFITILIIPYLRMKMFQYLGLEIFSLELKPKEKLKTHQSHLDDINVQTSSSDGRTVLARQNTRSRFGDRHGTVNYSRARKRYHEKDLKNLAPMAASNLPGTTEEKKENLFGIIPEKRQKTLCCKRLKEKNPLNFNYLEWFVSIFKKNPTPKMVLANRIQEEITQRTDIETVLAKFMEIELLKRILLTDEQNILFDNLCKPRMKLSYSYDNKNGLVYNYKLDDLLLNYAGNKVQAFEAYKVLINKPDKSSMDMELIMRYEKRQKRELNPEVDNPEILESWNAFE